MTGGKFNNNKIMANYILRPKTRTEWLELRKTGIGSSEIGTILGLNPFETPYQLWRRKKGIDAPKEENFAMRAGHYLEDAVSLFYRDETGKDIIKSSKGDWLIVNKDREYLRVSPDRTFWIPGRPHNQHNKGILECKTTQMQVDENDIPKHWFCQLQYQLGVAEYECGALAWLTQGREFGYNDIEFDPEFFAWEVENIEEFWKRYIIGDEEPLAINTADILLKSPAHVPGKEVVATPELMEAVEQLREIKAKGKLQKSEQGELEEELKMAIGDAEKLVDANGVTLATWKQAKGSTKFDERAFSDAEPDLYAKYLRPVAGSRRFLLK